MSITPKNPPRPPSPSGSPPRILALVAAATLSTVANTSWANANDSNHYLAHIKPVLKARCYACHGALKQKAGLRLDTAEAIHTGSKGGEILNLTAPDQSALIHRLSAEDPDDRMPPEGEPLEPSEIAEILKWIAQGAPRPENEQPDDDPKNHWAFQPPQAPPIPTPTSGPNSSSSNPIDRFIAEAHQRHGLRPQPPASKPVLLRRLYLDLIGLPPTRDQLHDFLNDPRPDAYARVADRLLQSPQYGERWGRHWMDVWRYSDWYGLGQQVRYSQKHIYHWRDWIIESLNADVGYDTMIRQMLAADETTPTHQPTLRATGFLVRNYYLFNRTTWLDNTLEHTAKAFLGLTLNCAKCHDHKYDPITHEDYYRFRAIFEPHQVRLDARPGQTDLEQDGLPRVFDAHPETPTYLHRRGNPMDADESMPLPPGPPEFLSSPNLNFDPQSKALPPEAHRPALHDWVLRDQLAKARSELNAYEEALRQAQTRHQPLTDEQPASNRVPNPPDAPPPTIAELEFQARDATAQAARAKLRWIQAAWQADRAQFGLNESSHSTESLTRDAASADRTYRLALAKKDVAQARWDLAKAEAKKRETSQKTLEKAIKARDQLASKPAAPEDAQAADYTPIRASRKALESPAETTESRDQPYPETTTGRRRALAAWITDPDNPLTARVAVNHIWLRHFGQPLVENVTDFGRRSKEPPLRPLLDYLSVQFMRHGWSMKWLHREIVLSDAYQRSSTTLDADPSTLAADANNDYYWRRLPIRMESQIIRDSVLQLAGTLTMEGGGPAIDPKQSAEADRHRRSVYYAHSRDDQHPFLVMFDDADHLACYRRSESVVPQQALALANSELSLEAASAIAARIKPEASSNPTGFIQAAFEAILGAPPDLAEREACLEFLQDTAPEYAPQYLVHALLNHNDFITIR